MTPLTITFTLSVAFAGIALGTILRRGSRTAMRKERAGNIDAEEQPWEPLWTYPWE